MVAIVGGKGFGLLNGSAGVLGQNGLFGNALFGSAKEKAVLNVSSGNLTLQDVDGLTVNTGVDLALTRTYNSLGNYFGSGFGHQWTDGLAKLSGLPATPDNPTSLRGTTLSRMAPDGSISLFTYDTARDAYTSTDGGGAYQTVRYDKTLQQWFWSGERDDKKGVYERYNLRGSLVGMGDETGIHNTYSYDANGRVTWIGNGSELTGFTYTTNADGSTTIDIRQTLSGSQSIKTSYTVDTLGRLTTVRNTGVGAGYAVTYGYDGNSDRIRSVVQSDGSTLAVTYDAQGRVAELVEHDNSGTPDRSTRLSYAVATDGSVTTTVLDKLGHQTVYVSDARGQLVRVTTPITGGTPITLVYSYNDNGDVISVSDGPGRLTTYEYDPHGNRTVERRADGTTVTRTYATYDPGKPTAQFGNQLLTESVAVGTDADGTGPLLAPALTTRYVLNAAGKVRFAITPQGRVTEYTYNPDGLVQREWTFMSGAYDVSGLQSNQVPTEAAVDLWSKGAVSTGLVSRTDYTYFRGRVATSTHFPNAPANNTAAPGGVATLYTYDLAGNLLSVKDGNLNTTTWTYDAFGRPLTQVDGNGTTLYAYAGNGTSVTTTDPSGVSTLRVYDSNGRLLSTTQSKGTLTLTTRNVYDAAGRLRMSIDQAGRQTIWLYDDAGRKLAEIGPDGAMTEYVYQTSSNALPGRIIQYATRIATSALFDATGKLLDTISWASIRPAATAFDRRTAHYYDAAGRLLAEVDPEGYLSRNLYDAAGRLNKTIERATAVRADQRDRDTLWSSAEDTVSAQDRVTETGYDADGKVILKIDPMGYRTQYVYNGGGLLTDTISYSKDNTVTLRTHRIYDGFGRMVASVDGDNYVTEYLYDGNGNVVRQIRYGTPTVYPAAATLAEVKQGLSATHPDVRATTYTYSALNQVLTETTTNPAGTVAGKSTTYTYDKFGNVKTKVRTAGIAAQYDYDDLGRLITETPFAGAKAIRHTYDNKGRRLSTTDKNGKRTLFFYDTAGRLVYTVNALGEVSERTYDAFGELAGERLYRTRIEATTLAALTGGDAARLPAPAQALADDRTYYYYDRDGLLRYTINGDGEATGRQYNAFGQVAVLQRYTTRLSSQAAAALTGGLPQPDLIAALGTAVQNTRYGFDNDGRLNYTVDALGNAESRAYDAFGRVTSIRQHAQTTAGQPVNSSSDSVVTMGYDNRGNVVSYADAASVVTTTYDAQGQAITVSRAGNYVGPAGTSGAATILQAATERTLYDAEGRITGKIDATGTVTVFKYDANDNLVERTTFATAATPAAAAAATSATIGTLVPANNALDARERYFYDAAGRLTTTLTASGANAWTVQTRRYNDTDDVVERRSYTTTMAVADRTAPTSASTATWIASNANPADAVQRMVYDGAGRLIATATRLLDNQWSIVALTYYSDGRVSQRTAFGKPLTAVAPTDADILAMAPSTADAMTAYRYDQAGRVLTTAVAQSMDVDAAGAFTVRWAVTNNDYNALGLLTSTTQYATAATNSRQFNFFTTLQAAALDRVDRYYYDAAGRLVGTVDAMRAYVGIAYDAKGNVTQRIAYATTSPDGKVPLSSPLDRVTQYVYNLNNQVAYEIDPSLAVTARDYDAFGNVTRETRYAQPLKSAPAANSTVAAVAALVVASSTDRTTRFYHDAAGRRRFTADPAGYLTETQYDALGRSLVDRAFQTAVPTTTTLADLAAAAAAQANGTVKPRTTSRTYDAQGNVLTTTDALGYVETNTYDALGNRKTLSKRPDVASTATVTWTYSYDAAGRLISEITPLIDIYAAPATEPVDGWASVAPTKGTLTTSYAYDTLGNLAQRAEGVTGATASRVTSYAYDLVGRQIRTTVPDTTVYDAANDKPPYSARTEKAATALTVEVTYNVFGDAMVNKDVGGNLSYQFYDNRGRVIRDVDASMNATTYAYNAFGDVVQVTRHTARVATPDGPLTASPDDRYVRTQYDVRGKAIVIMEPSVAINDDWMQPGVTQRTAARTTANVYDAFGDLIRRDVYGRGANDAQVTVSASTLIAYDLRGNETARIERATYKDNAQTGYLTTSSYDYAGRLLVRKEYATSTTSWTPATATVSASAADRTTTYTYDNLGNKLSERHTGLLTDATTTYNYDDLGRQRSTTDATGVKTVTYYDALGRTTGTAMIEKTANAAQSMPMSEFRLDAFGNVVFRIDYATSVPDGLAETTRPALPYDKARDRVTVNQYDALGRLKTSIDAERHATWYSYDVFGRVAKQWGIVNENTPYAQTAFELNRYDNLGRLTDVVRPGNYNVLTGSAAPDTTEHRAYNAFGEVTATTVSSGTQVLRSEETRYDNAGRAWLTNAGDGVYRATLYDVRGNATATFISAADGATSLKSLNSAVEVLGRADVRRVDTRYDLLGHVVDVSQSYAPHQFFLHREPDYTWIRVAYDPAKPEQDGLLVLGDRNDVGSTFTVNYRIKGTLPWRTSAARVQWVEGYPVFNTGALAQGTYELSITVKPTSGASFQLDAGELAIVAQPSEKKIGQLIELYLAMKQQVPDPNGLDYWLGRLNEGSTLAQIATEMVANKDVTTVIGGTTTTQILTKVLVMLGYTENTPAFADALKTWSARYDEVSFGTTDHGQVLVDLVAERASVLSNQVKVAQAYLTGGGSDPVKAEQFRKQALTAPDAALVDAKAAAADELRSMKLARLYIALLGRAPDPAGFAAFESGLRGTQTLTTTAQNILNSTEFRTILPATGLTTVQYNEQFVNRAYMALVGRVPSTAELNDAQAAFAAGTTFADWTVKLIDRIGSYAGTDAGAIADRRTSFAKTALALAFARMDMSAVDTQTQVQIARTLLDGSAPNASVATAAEQVKLKLKAQMLAKATYAAAANLVVKDHPLEALQLRLAQLYVAVLGRAPDRKGYDFWTDSLASGQATLAGVAKDMLAAAGAPAAGSTDADFIRTIYQRAFGSAIGADALTQWVGEVTRNGRAAAVIALIDDVTSSADPALKTARDLFNNRTAAGMTYALYMDGNNLQMAATMLAQVTATDTSAAIATAYKASDALAAAAAAETAKAAQNAAKLLADAATAALTLASRTRSEADAEALAAANPMAKYVLTAARLYVGLLNRGTTTKPLDLNGLVNMAGELMSQTDVQMAQNMLVSAEGGVIYPATLSNDAFVTQIYNQILHRVPDTAGLAFWSKSLASGQSRAAVAVSIMNTFLNGKLANTDPLKDDNLAGLQTFDAQVANALTAISQQATTAYNAATAALNAAVKAQGAVKAYTDALAAQSAAVNAAAGTNALVTLTLARLYVGVLNRPASGMALDYTGMTFWTNALIKNLDTPASIAQKFIDSAEGMRVFANASTPEQFIAQIYQQVLGRAPDAGAAGWVTNIKNGVRTRGQTAWDIIDSLVNHTAQLESEYNTRASFDQRVADAARAYSTAATTTSGIAGAAADVSAALTALNSANSALNDRQNELNAAWTAKTNADQAVAAARAGQNFYNSSYRDSLQELLVAFGRGTAYSTVEALLADLGAGRTTLQQLAGQGLSLSDKSAFYTTLYSTLLWRAPDAAGLAWWVQNTSTTDPGAAAYNFFLSALGELKGGQTSYRVRNNFPAELSAVTGPNNQRAKSLADGYSAAASTAQAALDRVRQAQVTYDTAAATQRQANSNYLDKVAINDVAKNTQTALARLLAIQDKAVLAGRTGATSITAMDASRLATKNYDVTAITWSLDTVIRESTKDAQADAAVAQDSNLSAALGQLAGANLQLLLSEQKIESTDKPTQNLIHVVQLYTTLFGSTRQPTLLELNSAMIQLRDGESLAAIADTLIGRDATLGAKTNSAFIDALYQNTSGRASDATGLAFWTKALSGPPAMTRGALATGFIDSLVIGTFNNDTAVFHGRVSTALASVSQSAAAAAQTPSTAAFVNAMALAMRDIRTRNDAAAQAALTPEARYAIEITQLYVTLLGRTPEPAALLSGIDQRRQGTPLDTIASSILASREIQGRLPATADNATFVRLLFAQSVGRAPTTDELNSLTAKLANGTSTRARLVIDFIASTYAYTGADPAVLTGRELLMGKVETALDDGAAGLQAYLQAVSSTTFNTALADALSKATLRYVDGYRTVLDSKTTGALVLHTTPNRMTVDRWGNVQTVADARNPNWLTTYTYNANNQMLDTALPDTGAGVLKVINRYDNMGRLLKTADVDAAGTMSHATDYAYDDKGALIRETRADGGSTLYTTDTFGQRLTSTQYLSGSQSVTYSYAYDRVGNLVSRTSAPVTVYDWAGTGTATAATAVANRSIVDAYSYDELGHRTVTRNYTVDAAGNKYGVVNTGTQVYDVGGNIIKSTDANGLTTYRAYDAFGNKIAEREASTAAPGSGTALRQSWTYDGYGRVLTHVDLGGNTTVNTYNGAGQLATTERRANGATTWARKTTFGYEGGTGYLVEVRDNDAITPALNQLVRYSYDRAGNRITEQTWLLGTNNLLQRALQDNVLGYNARSQLTDITSSVPGADYRIHYDYDAFGNRKKVTTGFTNDIGDKKAIEVNYEYDAMDRMTKVSGNVNTTYHAPVYTSTYLPKEKPGMTYEDIAPDVIVTWTSFDNKPIEAHTITYDWAGNRAIDNGETYGYDALGRLSTISTSAGQTGYRYYDSASRVIESRDGADVQLNDYDAGGRLVVQRMQGQSDRVQRSLVKYNYHNELGYLASYTAQGASGAKLQTTTNTVDVLRDTRLTSLTKVQNDGETAYKTSEMQYNLAGAMTAVTARNYKDGVATVDNANSRSMIGDYAGHVLEKTQNGLRTHTLMADDEMIGYSSAAYESFSSVHEGLSAASNADVGVYVVQSATDTLTSIAKSVWGDERL